MKNTFKKYDILCCVFRCILYQIWHCMILYCTSWPAGGPLRERGFFQPNPLISQVDWRICSAVAESLPWSRLCVWSPGDPTGTTRGHCGLAYGAGCPEEFRDIRGVPKCSINGGTPKWMIYIRESPIKMDKGYPHLWKPPIVMQHPKAS